ncbi:hypothetical protein PC116_g22788 [Phytophthora cactorum]|nr:hypothetical protein PC116_g22788 [Phytophthora cactorum]
MKVYSEGEAYYRQEPVRLDTGVREYGKTLASALIVEVPEVWYRLFTAGTHAPLQDVTSDPLADWTYRCASSSCG